MISISLSQTSSVSGSLVSSWNIPKQSTSYLKPVSAGPPGHLEGFKTIKTSDSEIKSCTAFWDRNGTYYQRNMMVKNE